LNSHILSQRLAAVAEFVPQKARLADIGSDHAYLPIFLVREGKIDYAIAGEVAHGPLKAASAQIKKYDLEEKITSRLADGLTAIYPKDQIDTIVIAGMGGILIESILTDGQKDGFLKGQRLILQPNNHESDVRHWLAVNHYKIYDEQIIEDHGKFYEIIAAYSQENSNYTSKELYFGPVLMQKKTATFKKKWQKKLETKQKVLRNLKNAYRPPKDKIEEEKRQMAWIEEVLF